MVVPLLVDDDSSDGILAAALELVEFANDIAELVRTEEDVVDGGAVIVAESVVDDTVGYVASELEGAYDGLIPGAVPLLLSPDKAVPPV